MGYQSAYVAPDARRPLRLGETIFGQIVVGSHPNAIAVPAAALVPDGEGFKVFVVDAENIAHEQPVTVGARTDSTAEITEGLKGGERVVTYGAYGVEDSVKVTTAPAPKAKGASGDGGASMIGGTFEELGTHLRQRPRAPGGALFTILGAAAPLRLPGRCTAHRGRHLVGASAAVGHLSGARVLPRHRRRERHRARRTPGAVQHNEADRGGDQHRSGRHACAVALDSRR